MAKFIPKKLIRGSHRLIIRAALTKLVQVENWDQRLQARNPGQDMSYLMYTPNSGTTEGVALQTVINRLQAMLAAKTQPPLPPLPPAPVPLLVP